MIDYQERMTEKYGDAEVLFNKCKPRYLSKGHLQMCENNIIRLKENIAINYWDMTPPVIKEIEVDGEIYTKVIKEKESKEFFMYWEQRERDYFEYDFELLDLKYKFLHHRWGHKGHHSPCLYLHPTSENDYVNYIYHLSEWGLLDNRIKSVFFGKEKLNYRYFDSLKEDINKEQTQDINIKIILESYGWNNEIVYEISLDTFFEMDYKKIKKYAYEYIEFFKNIGLFLKFTNYAQRILWHERKLQDAKEAERAVELMKANEHLFVERMEQTEYVRPKSKCYILKDHNTGLYKIGKSVNPVFREKTLQSEKPTIEAVKIFKQNHEDELHKKYNKHRVRGEWFKLNKIQLKYICRTYA
tara:strand:- start:491 stop:1558 length:1068 start_codon:yes stop_codon:yes gene_type:complete